MRKKLKIVCCIKECRKVLQEGSDDNVSHTYCEPCAAKFLWLDGFSQKELTEFANRHKETAVEA